MQGVQGALVLALPPRRAPRRRERRRTGPCTAPYRVVAARAGARPVQPPPWLRGVHAHPEVAALRKDWRGSVLAVAEVLAHTARLDATTGPTWPVLVEESGRSRATVARALAWLRGAQLLITVENGSTPQFRSRPRPRRDRPAPVEVEGNRCAVYLLTEPLPDVDDVDQGPDQSEHYASSQVRPTAKTETPPLHSSGVERKAPRTGARRTREGAAAGAEARFKEALDSKGRACRDYLAASGSTSGYRRGPRGTKGAQRAADLAVAAALRARSLDLRPLSDQAVRSVVRPRLAEGWGVEDFVWAIDHEPDGTARTFTAGPAAGGTGDVPAEVARERCRRGVLVDGGAAPARSVASPGAWLAWRLAPWADRPAPVAARRAEAAARADAARAAAAARQAANAAAAAAAVPPPPVLAEARAALRARRTSA